jgi:3-oxoacyl-(acyl-carrier-protein) synthase
VAASSAFGFGGAGAVLLFDEDTARPARSFAVRPPARVAVTGAATVSGRGVASGAACAEALSEVGGRSAPDVIGALEASRSRRFDAQTALVTLAAEQALGSAALPRAGVGLVAGTAFGSVERTAVFLRTIFDKGARRAAPAEFPHLLPSSSSGNASIYLGLEGPVMTASALDASAELSVLLACDLLDADVATAMVAGGTALRDAFSREVLGPVCRTAAQGVFDGAGFVVLEPEARAQHRGARPLAVLVGRGEGPRDGEGALALSPPPDVARALVVVSDGEAVRPLLSRSGWGGARVVTGVDSTAGVGVAFACATIARGDVDDALVLGLGHERVLALHLRRPS